MRYLSVCSGIEAATVAFHPLGWEAAAYAEIDPFPSAVLAHHYPRVPNLGDLTRHQEWPDVGPIDLLVGGTPCQSFSVAGRGDGLEDPRGRLMLSYVELAARLLPRWILWENVPGVLSKHRGHDFAVLLRELAHCGYGLAWRVLDAQYFGLAQRRKRVFLVGHLGDARRAAEVLFERESLRGDPPARRAKGEVAPTVPARRTAGGGFGTDFDLDGGLIAGTLGAAHGRNRGLGNENEHEMIVPSYAPEVSHSLRADGFDASEDGTGRGTPLIAFDETQITSKLNRNNPRPGDPCHPLASTARPPTIVGFDDVADPVAANQARTYTREGTHNFRVSNVAYHASGVRRLTPRECERLQGFPDDYTLIPYRGRPAKDGPRYKALGNSMAVPVMRWIATRLS